jgi:hypothetical protein
MRSINHPWAISDKYRARYGEVWANMDFVFAEKISQDVFSTDPMNTHIGDLCIFNQKIKMTYKDLINYSKSTLITCNESYAMGQRTDTYDIRIKSSTFTLNRLELRKLAETLDEAAASTLKAYELGLYL